ncbi:MAG: protein translocase subunit SecF [Bacillota bacterium]|nr:protein translocase subunit SecF [Bacillota bacterium]
MSLKDVRFNIVGKRKIWYCISLVIIIAGLVSFFVQGFNTGIDFTGGSILQLTFEKEVAVGELRSTVSDLVEHTPLIQESEGSNTFNIRTDLTTDDEVNELLAAIESSHGAYTIDRNEMVGPTIGKELTLNAFLALLIACALMLVYITIRFQLRFGIASIITLVHDALILLSVFSIFQLEISSSFIAAILTVIGYSINATIVIFDRVRENKPTYHADRIDDLVNDSVNQTLARSVNTVITTLLTLFALFFFGGETTRVFVLALIVGIAAGGYSSVFLSGSVYRDLCVHFGNKKK